ncbi:transcription elongation factor subunit Spt4 [Haladaptatus sp. CMAA 1911]|uniref:transcription elongation factor subunit Spt4 n=1 Tax=unclassified Haladaptatus TaxID=2622732 RepID=UPI0037549885
MTKVLACRNCNALVEKSVRRCPVCNAARFTDDWAGYVRIAHPNRSELGRRLGIIEPGGYALKVR